MAVDKHQGGCLCGKVRYTVIGNPTWTAGCCCRDCAKATGTSYVVWVGFPVAQVSYLSDAPAQRETSTGVLRGFFHACGTSLTYGRDPKYDVEDPLLYVSASTLDDPNRFPPTEVVWYSHRPRSLELAETIPLHPGISPEQADRSYIAARDRQ